jgi:DUF4097 and DUF4098 domain-containing protein YvlB
MGGEVVIRAGTDNRVRVRAEHASRDHIILEPRAGTLTIKAESRRGPPQPVDFDIVVPKWMSVSVSGVYTDASVEGTEGDITLETVQGTVSSIGGKGFIALQSVEGSVTIKGARGRVEATSVNEGIEIDDVVGDIQAETVNGDIAMTRVDATTVSATTVNGDVDYDGTIKNDGRYSFASHNGDVSVTVPQNANLTVSVSTYQGEFESCYEITLREFPKPRHRFSFTMGSGTPSGRLELESFQGDIRLLCPDGSGRRMRYQPKRNEKKHDEERE